MASLPPAWTLAENMGDLLWGINAERANVG